ncbi:hypothetical protein H9Q69_006629 [Fusarium xylarioides]|nr:hypothetical protein H9Q69_006629 [Fusarium xylarioides]
MKVAILGATGETGTSILNALLDSTEPQYEITALVRQSSLEKPEALALKEKGIKVVAADLSGPEGELTRVLDGIDTVISAISAAGLLLQIPLINAAKAAGVKRFLPCCFAPIMPPADLPDIGRWVARIIADPQTLNKMVFAYNTVLTMNQAYDLLEEASGEKTDRNYISEAAVMEGVARAEADCPPADSFDYFEVVKYQYFNALGIRGYNTPEYARYLGYVDATELYPDM